MSKKPKKCYYCGEPATSREHVPPKCIFPKEKNSLNGKNYRDNPIIVPSCDKHNSEKSTDDTYLLYILSMNIVANEHGHQQARTAVMRDIEVNQSLIKKMVKDMAPVHIEDGESYPTGAFNLEYERIDSVLQYIARAIYYHHFNRIFNGKIAVTVEFLTHIPENPSDSGNAQEKNKKIDNFREVMETGLKGEKYYGEHPEIFKYQCVWNKNESAIMRLHFYGDNKVTITFSS